ncbi:zinc-binding alcohol dehydrogenase family protein [Arsenicibacter rosenii]|uniref:NADPH:quinone reductase n=1 Tax=Arsenicibacter rosenii TaxID=1750698 RepID=A0A1S2VKX4_9BACT|nr:zinc-binding alcohol dehydrogenase family protein [Arsenicibacter rosenii]OIN59417.1 NADPH:quinone reductase [Arsenicibacter rosenii]
MKAAVVYQPGSPEAFVLEDRPIPVPGADQVLVNIKAFGLNRSELMTRKGLSPMVRFPRVLGIECAGEVVYDPSGTFPKGQQVLALMGGMGRDFDGSYAEYTLLAKHLLHPVSSNLPWEVLGALPEMFQTAHGSLTMTLAIQSGQTLLIRGGTSSVGMLATQLAAQAGLTVIATTRNPAKETALRENGATHVLIDDGALKAPVTQLVPDGVDKVLELIGTKTLRDSLTCLRPGGVCCMSGMLSETWSVPDFAPMEFIPPMTYLSVYDSGQLRSTTEAFQQFINQVEAGTVKLPISKVFTLDQLVDAHLFMENNLAAGKLVVLT